MKKLILLLLLPLFYFGLAAQKNYWQQEVNYTINVSLNDQEHTLTAFESIQYINHSPFPLSFIYFHLWPNAYKNDRTAFSDQLLSNNDVRFYFSTPEQKGYINQLDFQVDGTTAVIENDSLNIDIIKVILPKPIPPGGTSIITTPFRVKLPYIFSRSGYIGNDYQVTQWYPKPAVFDRKGWHPMPYLDQGEFYSEFGTFDVQITIPADYIVAATGALQDADQSKEGNKSANDNTKTWHYRQDSVHDFAWFAGKKYLVKNDNVRLPSGKEIKVAVYYKQDAKGWDKSMEYAKDGLQKYSQWLGDFPYNNMTVVQGNPSENSGGMEYPTITVISTRAAGRDLDETIVHEIGHNWFYGALATNERTHPWMDEGMNSFYQMRYAQEKYKDVALPKKSSFSNKFPVDENELLFATLAKMKKDQPIEIPADEMTSINYGLITYYKTSVWMKKLETTLGKDVFDKCMHSYYTNWKFKHPYPEDFKASVENTAGKQVDDVFNLLNTTGPILSIEKKTIKPSFLFNENNTAKYNYINIAPAIGYNSYDKAMIGGMIHNYQLPVNKFQFIGGGLYGTGSHKWNGFANASYNVYEKRSNLSMALSYLNYSTNDFVVNDKTTLYLRMQRITPSLSVTLFDKNPLSTRQFNVQLKTFLLKEGALNFETVFGSQDTFQIVNTVAVHSYINRLSLGVSDTRKLFPYSLTLSADQGKEFIKTGFTAKYFLNYPDKKSGMSVRFFAGKFFYLVHKTFFTRYNNDRYLLNLSAPNGYEDYTYSDYFIGRNEFEGWKSQQVMERDGFFKVNTELLSDKVGKTDDWLMTLNLSSGIPKKWNPLSVLPVNIPLKLFADIGTYAEAWKENPATGRFVYDGGLQLSLFASFINVYVPVVYSQVYKNYYKSTITEKRFLKTISFTINIDNLRLKHLLKGVPL